ncbi:hypothetical protein RRG08_000004 [Elysia crispata]|uniref:Uncharacterized protein n=1 Tax=Elysia crispata TaxID=231223 RepID=A0AAE0YZR5_9GAST|nr:hypothetical protein RRG08_000004 [Elysia crispata]
MAASTTQSSSIDKVLKICDPKCGGPTTPATALVDTVLSGCDDGYQGKKDVRRHVLRTPLEQTAQRNLQSKLWWRKRHLRKTSTDFVRLVVMMAMKEKDARLHVLATTLFGANCSEICSPNCGGPSNACSNVNGSCISGCDDGYHGESCQFPCTFGTFGANCSEICSPNCGGPNDACNNVNGFCISGCDDGYHGESCQFRK